MKLAAHRLWLPDAWYRLGPWLTWIPLFLVLTAWVVTMSVLDAGRRHDSTLGALALLTEKMPAPDTKMVSAADRERLSEFLVGSRFVLPVVADLELSEALDLGRKLDALEAAMAMSSVPPELLRSAISEVSVARVALLAAARRDARETQDFIRQLQATLIVLGALALALIALPIWVRRYREPAAQWRQLDHMLFDTVSVPIALTDLNDRVIEMNEPFQRLLNRQGEPVSELLLPLHTSDAIAISLRESMYAALADKDVWQGEFWMRRSDGEAVSHRMTRRRLFGHTGDPVGFVTIGNEAPIDDDERTLMMWQAHHDPLTKLPNRNLFNERLQQALLSVRDGHMGAVLSIDLDRFKLVNDSVGPSQGDQVLMEAGMRIALCAREGDTVARLGGDQFALVMPAINDYAEAEKVGRAVISRVADPFMLPDIEVALTASVGIVLFPDDASEPGTVLQRADAAKASAQDAGGNDVAFFESAMNSRAAARLELENDLRRAVAEQQFELHYQPLIDVQTGLTVGAEALLRWQHPERGMVSPGEFIPVAEESGLILPLGSWVLDEAQRQLHQWRAKGWSGFKLSLNLSPRQLHSQSDLEHVLSRLRHNLDDGLTIEITESLLVQNSDLVRRFIDEAGKRNVQIALDDFGTGFSSLSYLCDFNFDVLKIDRAFINGIEGSPRLLGLVASIVSMGRILGMQVVAEGVETDTQLRLLKQVGCDLLQGFHFSKPLPVGEFERYYEKQGQHNEPLHESDPADPSPEVSAASD